LAIKEGQGRKELLAGASGEEKNCGLGSGKTGVSESGRIIGRGKKGCQSISIDFDRRGKT
jgi:hypothetical protein